MSRVSKNQKQKKEKKQRKRLLHKAKPSDIFTTFSRATHNEASSLFFAKLLSYSESRRRRNEKFTAQDDIV